jgi:DNA replication protein DnaC
MDDKLSTLLKRIEQDRLKAMENGTLEPKPNYKCEKCQDKEWIFRVDERGYEYAKKCECWERNTALRLMASSGISEEDTKKGFRDFNTFNEQGLEFAKNTAIKYFKDFDEIKESRHNSLLLCGASGRGKTTLGLAVANNLMQKCINVRYMPYREEVTRLKQEITDEYTYSEHMNKLKTAKVLFIDDLLKGKITESDINILYEIINYRYLERLPVIVSTEKVTNELLDFDEAIGSRLLEMCKGYVVTFSKDIPNYRMR